MFHPDQILREGKRRLERDHEVARTWALVPRVGARHRLAATLRSWAARLEPEDTSSTGSTGYMPLPSHRL